MAKSFEAFITVRERIFAERDVYGTYFCKIYSALLPFRQNKSVTDRDLQKCQTTWPCFYSFVIVFLLFY